MFQHCALSSYALTCALLRKDRLREEAAPTACANRARGRAYDDACVLVLGGTTCLTLLV